MCITVHNSGHKLSISISRSDFLVDLPTFIHNKKSAQHASGSAVDAFEVVKLCGGV